MTFIWDQHRYRLATLTRLEWALECGDRKTAYQGAGDLLYTMVKEIVRADSSALARRDELYAGVYSLRYRSAPIRITSWARVLGVEDP